MPPPWAKTPPSSPWMLPGGTPPLELPVADTPESHRPVLALDAGVLGQDATVLALDAAERDKQACASLFPTEHGPADLSIHPVAVA